MEPVATITEDITYIITAANSLGCETSDTIRIRAVCDESVFYVANTFTPNGDGLDDWFYVQGKGVTKVDRFAVMNRWGELVFERKNMAVNDPYSGWNGSWKGENLSSDVFLYLIEAKCGNGTPVYLKGDINLIR